MIESQAGRTDKWSASKAAVFALNRALAVFWGGMVAAALYLAMIIVGPTVEGRYFPVVTGFHLMGFQHEPDGSISFVPVFNKTRDCAFFGSSWFAPDADGNFVRLQIRPKDEPIGPPPVGRPLGPGVGGRQIIHLPPDASMFMAVMNHDCGLVWQTRTMVGPFAASDGRLLPRDS